MKLNQVTVLEVRGYILNCLSASPDGRWIAVGGRDADDKGYVSLWKSSDPSPLKISTAPDGQVGVMRFSNDGTILASAAIDASVIRLWKLPELSALATLPLGVRAGVEQARPEAGRDNVAPAERGQGSWLEIVQSGDGITDVRSIAFSPNDKVIAVGCSDLTAKVYHLGRRPRTEILEGKRSSDVDYVAFVDSGSKLVVGTVGEIELWDLKSRKMSRRVRLPNKEPVWNHALSPDEQSLASVATSGVLRVWDFSTWKSRELPLPLKPRLLPSFEFSPDSREVLIASDRNLVFCSVAGDSTRVAKFDLPIASAAHLPDGQHVAVLLRRPGTPVRLGIYSKVQS